MHSGEMRTLWLRQLLESCDAAQFWNSLVLNRPRGTEAIKPEAKPSDVQSERNCFPSL